MTSSHQRLTVNQTPGVGANFFTATQRFFRETNARGRWARDMNAGEAQAYGIKSYDDGTVDCTRLESTPAGWVDLGGQGAVDVRVGRF